MAFRQHVSALFTDLYEVTMAQAYWAQRMSGAAVFETSFRKLPRGRSYLVAAGLVIELANRLGERFTVRAVRLDSGDLGALSKAARARLDAAGLTQVGIFASSGVDEYRVAALLDDGCPIDGFGVGTRLCVAEDAPALDMAYKLVEYAGIGRTKFSSGKTIYPGRKQVFRRLDHGTFAEDTLGQPNEKLTGEPLLVPVMKDGRRLAQFDGSLETARARARQQIEALPPHLRSLDDAGWSYPVVVSPGVAGELERLRRAQQ
jgi:nicotinate phosphoribosyltransferase